MQILVVSIHDVSPQTQTLVEEIINDLKVQGVHRCSLLVIPNHHNIGWLEAFPTFVTWLHQKFQEGHEIVLHGLFHHRPRCSQEKFLEKFITQYYTADEGEFFDLSYEEASQKLSRGRTELEKIGFSKEVCVGFIAPAWLLSTAAQQAVHDGGFWYTTRLKGILDMTRESSFYHPSQSMVYSVRAPWRRWMSLFWNEFLFQTLTKKKKQLLRLSLHPPDWNYPKIRAHALRSVKRALSDRVVMTYREWVESKE